MMQDVPINPKTQPTDVLTFPLDRENFHIKQVAVQSITPIKYPRPFYDATMGPFKEYRACFLRITDESGFEGECEYPINSIGYLENYFAPVLLNAGKTSYASLYNTLFWSIRNEGFRGGAALALGHLDRAFYDLVAKRNNMPVHQYLAASSTKVKAYASGGGVNIIGEELINECLEWEAEGYDTIKIKFGGLHSSTKEDVQRIASVREALHPDTNLAIDANQSMNLPKALGLVRELEGLDIAWLEEPIQSASLYEIEQLCARSSIKIAYGESERSAKVFPSIIRSGVEHLQPIAGHINSIKDWFEISGLSKSAGLDFTSGGTSYINCQFVAALGNNAMLEFLAPIIKPMEDLFSVKPVVQQGYFVLPGVPGIGIQVDWHKLEKENRIVGKQVWK